MRCFPELVVESLRRVAAALGGSCKILQTIEGWKSTSTHVSKSDTQTKAYREMNTDEERNLELAVCVCVWVFVSVSRVVSPKALNSGLKV